MMRCLNYASTDRDNGIGVGNGGGNGGGDTNRLSFSLD